MTLQLTEQARDSRWRVDLRGKTGQTLPVVVESAPAEYVAISRAMNKAERFLPGQNWKPISANRAL